MKQTKKLLSLLLAIVMILSSLSVLASAYGTPYKNEAITDYTAIDKPVLTTEQYATAALDYVDEILGELKEGKDGGKINIYIVEVDYTSLNNVFEAIDTITDGSVWNGLKGLLGGLQNLDFTAVKGIRRTDGGSDLAILEALLSFLNANKGLVGDFVEGNLDLGSIVASFVDLSDFEVKGLLKDILYEAVYKPLDAPETGVTQTVDQMAQDAIDKFIITGWDDDEPLLPVLGEQQYAGYTDISSGSALDFIDRALKVVYNEWLVDRANEVWMDDINELLAKEEVQKYLSYFNVDSEGKAAFEFQRYDFDDNKLVLEQLNDILADIINLALNPDGDIVWESGDNSMIVENIITIGKQVLADTGDDFFESFVEVKTAEELDAMTEQEVVAYVARTILNSSIDGVWIPNTADSIVKVGSYLVKDLMAVELPERDYQSETAYPVDDINTVYSILTDFGIKALNENPGLELNYGIGLDALATAAANWAINEYGGLLSGVYGNIVTTAKTGWANLDGLLFSIVNRNWFDASLFNGKPVTAENLIKDVLIGNIVNLDFENVIALLCNKSSSSEFVSCTPKQFVINLVTRVLNIVFPGALSTSLTSLEAIIDVNNLANTAKALLGDLYTYRSGLLKCILPIVTDALGATKEEEFAKPEIIIEDSYNVAGGLPSFTVYNPAGGVNTGYTDASGVFHQDALFKIRLDGVTVSATSASNGAVTTGSLTAELPANRIIDADQTATVAFKGTAPTGMNDVQVVLQYTILREDGQPLTDQPFEAVFYTCFTKTANQKDDAENVVTSNAVNGVTISYPAAFYLTDPEDLEDITVKVTNKSGANIQACGGALSTTASNLANPTFKSTGLVEPNTDLVTVYNGGSANVSIFKFTDAFDPEETADLDALYNYSGIGFKRYAETIYVKFGNSTVSSKAAVAFVIYNDYGLNDLFNDEYEAQRQPGDYDATAFAAYRAAMKNAATLCKTLRVNNMYAPNQYNQYTKITKFAQYYEALASAVETLEESRVGGVQALADRLDELKEIPGLNSRSFMTYTWSNFRDHRNDAEDFVDSYTNENSKNYGKNPAGVDVAYLLWELNNYYNRLRPVAPSKVNLALEIEEEPTRGFDQTLYTEESWARLEDAIAAAEAVNANSGAFQNEINDAYVELIEAQKRLVPAEEEEPEVGEWAVAAVSPVDPAYAPQIVVNSAGEKLLLGVAPASIVSDVSAYFDLPAGFTASCDDIATGSEVTIKNGDTVVDTVILVIKGDVDASGTADTVDSSTIDRAILGLVEISSVIDSASIYAADVDASGSYDTVDSSMIDRAILGMVEINYAAV